MPHFTYDWFSHNIPSLKKNLNEFVDKPIFFMEIGSFQGRSALWFLENILTHQESRLICIEPFTGNIENSPSVVENMGEIFKNNVLMSPYGEKVALIDKPSKEALMMPALRGLQFDVIYVDGDHRAAAVMADAVLAFDLLKSGGIMIFDDFMGGGDKMMTPEQPHIGVLGFTNAYAPYIDIIHQEYQLMFKKK